MEEHYTLGEGVLQKEGENVSAETLKRILEQLERKPARTVLQVSEKNIEHLLKEYEERLAKAIEKTRILPVGLIDTDILGETIREVVEGYRTLITELYRYAAERRGWQAEELKLLAEQANTEIMQLLRQVLALLERLGANADLEREVLEKLKSELNRK